MVAITLIASVSVFAQDNGTSAEWGYKPSNSEGPTQKKPENTAENLDVSNKLIPYEDLSKFQFISKVIELPGKSQKDVLNMFKNWASTSFVNLKVVIVSETDNQIVVNYITETSTFMKVLGMKSQYEISWYVRLVAQFKEGKMRLIAYDDGNAFKPGTYNQYGGSPAIQRNTFKISSTQNAPIDEKEFNKNDFMWYRLHLQWQKNVKRLVDNAGEEIKKVSTEESKKDNW